MNAAKMTFALIIALLMLALPGCSGSKPAQKEGVVYLDPNAVPAAATAAASEPVQEAAPADPTATREPAEKATEDALDLYFECKGVRMAPMMEAAPVLAALGEPLRSFEADSCAYLGKDLFYAYPGVELTVNQVEGVGRITSIHVTDDTVTTPQGLRIYDEEEKLLSALGGEDDDGIYTFRSGQVELLIEVKETEGGVRRIWSIEYRAAEDR